MPLSAKNNAVPIFSDWKNQEQAKTGKVISGRQNIVVHRKHVDSAADSSSLETLKAHATGKIDDRNNTFSDAAPF